MARYLTPAEQDRREALIEVAERNNQGDWLRRSRNKPVGVLVPETFDSRHRGETHKHIHHRRHPGQHRIHTTAA